MENTASLRLEGLVRGISARISATLLALLAATGCDGRAADTATIEDSRGQDLITEAPPNTDATAASSAGETETEFRHDPLPVTAPVVIGPPARFVPAVPAELAEGAGIIESYGWALALGKALFWDQQVGSDGQACASCHFNAGADARITNQLNPGFLDLTGEAGGDTAFGSNRSDNGGRAPGTSSRRP